jgi:hypothetical protein
MVGVIFLLTDPEPGGIGLCVSDRFKAGLRLLKKPFEARRIWR